MPSCAMKGPSTTSRCNLLRETMLKILSRRGLQQSCCHSIVPRPRISWRWPSPPAPSASSDTQHSVLNLHRCSDFSGYLGSARTGLGAIRGYFKWRHSTNVISLRTARLAASFSAMMVSIFGETLFFSISNTYRSQEITNNHTSEEEKGAYSNIQLR